MAVQKINLEQFLEMAKTSLVLDVRSPGEFSHAHIPGACSLPLFSDAERAVVGTDYKQKSRETAIKTGLDFFGVKMRKMVEETEALMNERLKATGKNPSENIAFSGHADRTVLVHCWRGGMRSAGVAWLLDLYGFKVFTLAGGYKTYREWVRIQFEKAYSFKVVGGYTGSGKTLLLEQLEQAGQPIINLEKLASHKGSAFGALGEQAQPRQEMFENRLAMALSGHSIDTVTWIEDESNRIGNLNIPPSLWARMRNSPVYFLDIPFEERLDYITIEYGKFEKEKLVNAIIRIQKRLGGLDTKNAVNFLLEDNVKECFRILLKYYDKWYGKGLENRENLAALLNKIPCPGVDTLVNTQKLLHAGILTEKTL